MLVVEHLQKSFGGVAATNDVSLAFPEGSLSAIIGPNGAGKTTLFNLITGVLRPDAGRILLGERNIVGLPSNRIVHLGLGRAFQVSKLFATLTVEDSLRAALMSPLGKSLHLGRRFPLAETRDRAWQVMQQLGLQAKARVISGTLSHGDQKLLDIALALVLEPRVLLLDEPVAGMGPEERERMIQTVHDLWRQGGLTLIFIEHDMGIVFRIAQRIHVLSYGRLLASGDADAIRGNAAVVEAYLGRPREARA